ncbi:hypothetical protein SPHINGO8AM_220032 [Sphingomonas sp. 8AM]|nr:hypothetical protein SPHINGO8AM_220032 [Sphingomonas sp. 8AM]
MNTSIRVQTSNPLRGYQMTHQLRASALTLQSDPLLDQE